MKTEAVFWDDLMITSCYVEVLDHMHHHHPPKTTNKQTNKQTNNKTNKQTKTQWFVILGCVWFEAAPASPSGPAQLTVTGRQTHPEADKRAHEHTHARACV